MFLFGWPIFSCYVRFREGTTHEFSARQTRKGFETETGELPSAQDFAEEVWDRQGCRAIQSWETGGFCLFLAISMPRFPFVSLRMNLGKIMIDHGLEATFIKKNVYIYIYLCIYIYNIHNAKKEHLHTHTHIIDAVFFTLSNYQL